MKNKVIVTGGAGFIGSKLVDALVAGGYEVWVIDNLNTGKKDQVNAKAILHQVDVRDLAAIKPLIKGAKYVWHLAAMPSVPYSIEQPTVTNEVNLIGTLNVLLAAKEAAVERLVYSASSAAYGEQAVSPQTEGLLPDPKHPYGVQKYVGELYARVFSGVYGLPTVSLRYFNVYGPGQNPYGPYAGAIPKFISLRQAGKPMTIFGNGEQTRDFVHVGDVVRANLAAMSSDKVGQGEVINIGGATATKIADIAKMIGGPIEYLPPRPEVKDSLADISKARELLVWSPEISIESGIGELKTLAGLV